MKKVNFLKTVLGIAFVMLSVSMFGQQIPAPPYALYNVAAADDDSIDYITVKAGGTTMGYYVTPDPVYHPNYTLAGSWALTAGFLWNWTVAPAGPTFNPASPVLNSNYVRITFPNAVQNYTVKVAERAPASMGGCEDATPTKLRVHVIAAPTGAMTIAPLPAVDWQQITANQAYQICGNQAAQTVTINFVENVPVALAGYSFQITRDIDLIDAVGTVIVDGAESIIQNFDTTTVGKLKVGNVGTLTGATFVTTGAPTYAFTFSSDALNVQANAGVNYRTRYTYEVQRSTGTVNTNNDFISAITHKSDALAGSISNYAFTAASTAVSFIVNPSPSTGSIYHIPNTFKY